MLQYFSVFITIIIFWRMLNRITHIKPAGNNEAQIKKQLSQLNQLKLHLIFPQQAHLLKL